MPRIERRNLRQYIVLWECIGVDDNGDPKLSPPVEIKGTWNDKLPSGNSQVGVIDVEAVVKRSIPKNSAMFKGRLSNLPPILDPRLPNTSIYRVALYLENESLTGKGIRRKVLLSRLGATRPPGE